jgi:hypothetical protein
MRAGWGEWDEGVFRLIRNGSKDYSVGEPIPFVGSSARPTASGDQTSVELAETALPPVHEE